MITNFTMREQTEVPGYDDNKSVDTCAHGDLFAFPTVSIGVTQYKYENGHPVGIENKLSMLMSIDEAKALIKELRADIKKAEADNKEARARGE